jgi:heme a synthase
MSGNENSPGVYRFALATACCTILLLMAGALVTSNNAADSVPDWPLAYGRLIPPLVGGIRWEYAHRVMAGLVSVLTLILAVWLAWKDPRALARRLGWTALGLVIAQAALGGVRVLVGHAAVSATAHATLAQIFFITVVGLAMYLSPWWQHEQAQLDDSSSPSVRSLALGTTIAVFFQLILGAAFRHGAFGIGPHLLGAAVVTVLVVWTGRNVKQKFRQVRALRSGVVLLHATFGIQILLGGAAMWAVTQASKSPQPTAMYVILTVAHVLGGALVLASSMLLTLSCFRLMRSDAVVSHSPVARPGYPTAGR